MPLPRNVLGGIVESKRFAGGPSPDGQGGVPNITQAKLGDWSAEGYRRLLETARRRTADPVGGSDGRVIAQYLAADAGDRARDGRLHQVAAAALKWPKKPEKK